MKKVIAIICLLAVVTTGFFVYAWETGIINKESSVFNNKTSYANITNATDRKKKYGNIENLSLPLQDLSTIRWYFEKAIGVNMDEVEYCRFYPHQSGTMLIQYKYNNDYRYVTLSTSMYWNALYNSTRVTGKMGFAQASVTKVENHENVFYLDDGDYGFGNIYIILNKKGFVERIVNPNHPQIGITDYSFNNEIVVGLKEYAVSDNLEDVLCGNFDSKEPDCEMEFCYSDEKLLEIKVSKKTDKSNYVYEYNDDDLLTTISAYDFLNNQKRLRSKVIIEKSDGEKLSKLISEIYQNTRTIKQAWEVEYRDNGNVICTETSYDEDLN